MCGNPRVQGERFIEEEVFYTPGSGARHRRVGRPRLTGTLTKKQHAAAKRSRSLSRCRKQCPTAKTCSKKATRSRCRSKSRSRSHSRSRKSSSRSRAGSKNLYHWA